MAQPHVTALAGMACVVIALVFQAVRAFSLLSVVSMVTCVGLLVLSVVKSDVIMLAYLPVLAASAGALCSLIAFSVFAAKEKDKMKQDGVTLDYSFYFTVVACLLSIVAAILFSVAVMRRADYVNL